MDRQPTMDVWGEILALRIVLKSVLLDVARFPNGAERIETMHRLADQAVDGFGLHGADPAEEMRIRAKAQAAITDLFSTAEGFLQSTGHPPPKSG